MIKASFLFLLLICAIALLGTYNALFPVPASTAFIRFFGLSAFLLLCISLMLGPLMVLWPSAFGALMEPRRAIGIASFVFVLLHLFVLVVERLGFDILAILGFSNIWISLSATIILLVLAITSSDFVVRTMGAGFWKNVQRLNYLAFVLSFVHFALNSNGIFINVRGKTFVNLAEVALVLLGIITVLLQLAGFILREKRKSEANAAGKQEPLGNGSN